MLVSQKISWQCFREEDMRLQFLLIPFAGLLLAADANPPKGLEKFQGTWKLTALVVEGKEIGAEGLKAKLTLKGNKYTYTNGDMTSGGIYKVDPGKKPHTLDIVITEGNDKGKTMPAIYEVEDGLLRICLSFKGKDRPQEFASKAASGTVLETWKKTTE